LRFLRPKIPVVKPPIPEEDPPAFVVPLPIVEDPTEFVVPLPIVEDPPEDPDEPDEPEVCKCGGGPKNHWARSWVLSH